MSGAPMRKGWCPGALRPMAASDGLIVRVRLAGGRLPVAVAHALADLSARHGNGGIDLTRRANLQLRGVSEASLPKLIDALDALGLIDPSPESEAVRNVLVSPLAGLDPLCRDGRSLAAALVERLRDDTHLQAVPGKFSYAIDGGGIWPLGETGSDITALADGGCWRLRLEGAATAVSQKLPETAVVGAIAAVASAFAATGHPRMRHWLAASEPGAIFSAAGLAADTGWQPSADPTVPPKPGLHALAGGPTVAAVGVAFGSLRAEQLEGLAGACLPATVLRLTPWRLIAAPTAHATLAARLLEASASFGLVTESGDPRSGIQACTGAPGCSSASTPTRADAARLAGYLRSAAAGASTMLHVSGCAKGCAHGGPAPITLVAKGGRYDLIVEGGVAHAPRRTAIAPADLVAALRQEGVIA